jgi:hypothetical protein
MDEPSFSASQAGPSSDVLPQRVRYDLGWMSALNPTPPDKLVDRQGRPYFLWDMDMTLDAFRAALQDDDPEVRGYLVGKLMRQAKPDDVFTFVSVTEIRELWTVVERHLGKTREFWVWLLDTWKEQGVA